MHAAALRGFTRNLEAIPGLERTLMRRALDMGGQDVNGTVHNVLRDRTGWGIHLDVLDIEAGAGVTVVGDARRVDWWDGQPYDLVISTEMLEHLSQWGAAIEAVHEVLRPGGWFVGTCASIRRGPHGATGAPLPAEGEWYQNVWPSDLVTELIDMGFDHIEVQYQRDPAEPTTHDLYWRARKAS